MRIQIIHTVFCAVIYTNADVRDARVDIFPVHRQREIERGGEGREKEIEGYSSWENRRAGMLTPLTDGVSIASGERI